MKNTMHYLFISLVFFLIPQAVIADSVEDAEAIYGKCLDKTEGITIEIRDCAYEHTINLKNYLNKVWQAVVTQHRESNEMPDEHKNAILSSLQEEQQKWEEYKNIACTHFTGTSLQRGTIAYTYASVCHHRVLTQRIEILRKEFCAGRLNNCEAP